MKWAVPGSCSSPLNGITFGCYGNVLFLLIQMGQLAWRLSFKSLLPCLFLEKNNPNTFFICWEDGHVRGHTGQIFVKAMPMLTSLPSPNHIPSSTGRLGTHGTYIMNLVGHMLAWGLGQHPFFTSECGVLPLSHSCRWFLDENTFPR